MTDKPFPPVFATNRPEKGESVADEVNRLLRGLREQLKVAPSIAIATAYLNAQGFELLAEELEKAPKVRLLLGAEVQQPEERALERRPDDGKTLAKALEDHEKGLKIERDLAGFTVERDRAERAPRDRRRRLQVRADDRGTGGLYRGPSGRHAHVR